ncbi:MAG: HEAT repeat domain-containing protein [Firmicutes bacterium]|nr:HEAT repeat domain-containing protein [Bacillota bacterium]
MGKPLLNFQSISFADLAGHAMGLSMVLGRLMGSLEEVELSPEIMAQWDEVELANPSIQALMKAFQDHGVQKLALNREVTVPELQSLLGGLGQPASSMANEGGLRGHLEKSYIQSIQIRTAAALPPHLPLLLVQETRQALHKALAPRDFLTWNHTGWLHYLADFRHFGPVAVRLGLGKGEPSPAALELLEFTLQELSPDQFLSISRGLGSLPQHPEGLKLAFQHLVPRLLASRVEMLVERGLHWLVLQHPLEDVAAAFPGQLSALIEPMRQGLVNIDEGSRPLVESFLADLAWQAQNLTQQLEQTRTAEEFLALSVEARAQLMDRTLKTHRTDALIELVGHLGEATANNSHRTRLATIRAFLPMAVQRTVPDYVMDCVEEILITAYKSDLDDESTGLVKEAILDGLRIRLARKQPDKLVRILRALEGKDQTRLTDLHILSVPLSWSRQTLESEAFLDLALECLFQGERQDSLMTCMILFTYIGDALYRRVVWRLGRESDRNRRDRMVRVLITAGPDVEDALHSQLRPSMPWYHARNLLFVLAQIGTARSLQRLPSFLDHADARVRIVALRALNHCSRGKMALGHLVARLEDPDESIRQEAVQLLGTLRKSDTLRALESLASDRQVPMDSRTAAIQAIGETRLPEATELLLGLIRSRGSILKRGIPDPLRLVAAKTLIQLPNGRQHLMHEVEQEAKGPLAQSMAQLLRKS